VNNHSYVKPSSSNQTNPIFVVFTEGSLNTVLALKT
jgi:hypothetical protein